MKKRVIAAVLSLAMIFSMCTAMAIAAPPAPPAKESDDYTGPVIDYPDKELWFDSTMYDGFFSAYQIMAGNGDDTFDIDAFINSKQGELTMSRVKYELVLIGRGQWAGEDMVNYWKEQGVIETTHDADDPTHEWITYVPEYMYAEENAGKVYPVVFAFHGAGNDLFTSQNLGFVHICYDNEFIVVTPEAEDSNGDYMVENLPVYLDKLEAKGYPIDRTRVYAGGMSKGGMCTLTIGAGCSDMVAAIAPHSSAFGLGVDVSETNGMPVWLQIGESDLHQLPMSQEVIDGLNNWLAMNNCPTRATATDSNMIGITADKVYTQELDGTTYTFAEFYNTDGVKTMVVVGIEGLPHWVSYSYPQLAWDFMKKYSIVDGERVYTDSISATNVVANCHIGTFGQTVDSIELALDDPSILSSIQADGFTIENASKFVGMIPCAPYVESVEVKDGKLLLTMGGDEFLLYKSDGSEKGEPLKVSYDKDGIQFSFSYADITANNGAIDNMAEKYFEGMQYFSYEPDSSKPLPLVVFLHGGNLAGLQRTALAAVDALVQPEFQAKHPCYVLAPTSMKHLNGEMGWDKEERDQVIALIQSYVNTGKIDANRIYLSGNSMGSGGAINTALENPDLFAAVMPMSGPLRGIAEDEAMQEQFRTQVDGVLNVPFMIVMAKSDPVANYPDGVCMYEIMTEKGANVQTTFYEDSQLVESGVIEYTHAADAMAKYDPALFEWMFAQTKEYTLVKRDDGFYSCYDQNGELVKFDYVKLGEKLYFFNSKGIGVEIDYVWISDHIVQIFDNSADSCFIVIGDEKAAVIDAMNGTIDLSKVARFFTDKPLIAIATHFHGDHTGGLYVFPEIYINEDDFDLLNAGGDADTRFRMLSYGNYQFETGSELDYTIVNIREDMIEKDENMRLLPLKHNQKFDLGGVTVEALDLKGHTPGSMAMLIAEDSVLITGDAANKYTQIAGYTVEGYLESLKGIKAREADYSDIYSSHGALLPDGTNGSHMAGNIIDELIEGCESVLNGTNEGYPPAPGAPTRWAFEASDQGGRVDGGCGNFMFNPGLIWNTKEPEGAPNTLVTRDDGFYSYYDQNGELVKFDYVKLGEKLYFFNSRGIGVEIDYVKISDHVIQIFDNTNDSAFIVIGDNQAAVIDGMNGTVDLIKIARFFTDKPLVAVLTHGHGDHTGGVQSFDEVHLNAADFELYASMIAGDFRFGMIGYDNYLADTGSTLDYTLVNIREDFMEQNPNLRLIPIEDSEIFELGGISIECIAAPGHTAGSMAMLIREDRVLITGDAANKYTQVQGYPVEGYLQTLLKLKAREADYDDIYSSHGALTPDGTNTAHMADTMIDELIEGCRSILNGTNEGVMVDPNAPVRWAYAMGPTGRADGKCGNFMFNTMLIWINEPSETTYTVVKGDTLWEIAKKHLGSGTKWSAIYEANKDKIKNPNWIYPGQVLNIPANQ